MTGINNNAHQVKRAQQITAESGRFVAERCSFVQSDFMKLPFADATYDHAYAIEATCHAPDAAACYREIARCIKPGGMFVCYEWVRRYPCGRYYSCHHDPYMHSTCCLPEFFSRHQC